MIREATSEDTPLLTGLIARSARGLGSQHYRAAQIEAALTGAFGVDSQLLRDRTYFAVEHGHRLVACGGWSYRRTLFGSDAARERDGACLDPLVDAARIRAFFVDPGFARRGIGRRLLEHCEAAAAARGFSRFELMATLPGVALYESCGYVREAMIRYPLSDETSIEFVPMHKGTNPSH